MVQQFLVYGLLDGALFAAIAIGFALVWGVNGIINLAHGEMVMLGAYTTYWFHQVLASDPSLLVVLATVPVAAGLLFAVGYGVQRLLIERVAQTNIFLTLLVTFGLSIFIQQLAIQAWTATPRGIPFTFADPSIEVAGLFIPKLRLFVFFGAIGLSVAVWLFVTRTRTGRAIRAVSQDEQTAALLGIDVERIRAISFGISAAIAGAAGSFVAVLLTVRPQMGLAYTIRSFIIVVFGGIGSIIGALLGGLTLGEIESLATGLIGSQWSLAASYVFLILLLVVRPQGLFGQERGAG